MKYRPIIFNWPIFFIILLSILIFVTLFSADTICINGPCYGAGNTFFYPLYNVKLPSYFLIYVLFFIFRNIFRAKKFKKLTEASKKNKITKNINREFKIITIVFILLLSIQISQWFILVNMLRKYKEENPRITNCTPEVVIGIIDGQEVYCNQ